MRLVDATKPMFAKHETFHPRYGWFRKAYNFVAADPQIFSREDAPVRVGVGKNMVRAIRFWGIAAKLIDVGQGSSRHRTRDLVPTCLGHSLFGDSGWDRYMEDPGTLWLLHWLLLSPPCLLPVWWLAFNEFHALEFSDDHLEAVVATQLEAAAGWAAPHPSSVRKDVSALLRTYAPAERSRRIGIEDVLDCPLRELNLIGRSATTHRYRFALGAKRALPPAVLAYAALDYVARTNAGGNTVTLGRLAHEPGGPGRIFKLTEGELFAALESLVDGVDSLALTATTGSVQLSWSDEPREIGKEILDCYYGFSIPNTQVGHAVHKDEWSTVFASAKGL
ncbi:MAG: DUF4007 family protein [Rhodobacteraceae bacterium]|nr:DUF4007 family protein [Paracoccaceae bacterium]